MLVANGDSLTMFDPRPRARANAFGFAEIPPMCFNPPLVRGRTRSIFALLDPATCFNLRPRARANIRTRAAERAADEFQSAPSCEGER